MNAYDAVNERLAAMEADIEKLTQAFKRSDVGMCEALGRLRERIEMLEPKASGAAIQTQKRHRDVTANCDMNAGRLFNGFDRVAMLDRGYHFRKVKLYPGYCCTEQCDAFIIEQEEP